jgi:hypothetical protein
MASAEICDAETYMKPSGEYEIPSGQTTSWIAGERAKPKLWPGETTDTVRRHFCRIELQSVVDGPRHSIGFNKYQTWNRLEACGNGKSG